jgi:hypothetical protein
LIHTVNHAVFGYSESSHSQCTLEVRRDLQAEFDSQRFCNRYVKLWELSREERNRFWSPVADTCLGAGIGTQISPLHPRWQTSFHPHSLS